MRCIHHSEEKTTCSKMQLLEHAVEFKFELSPKISARQHGNSIASGKIHLSIGDLKIAANNCSFPLPLSKRWQIVQLAASAFRDDCVYTCWNFLYCYLSMRFT